MSNSTSTLLLVLALTTPACVVGAGSGADAATCVTPEVAGSWRGTWTITSASCVPTTVGMSRPMDVELTTDGWAAGFTRAEPDSVDGQCRLVQHWVDGDDEIIAITTQTADGLEVDWTSWSDNCSGTSHISLTR